MKLFLSMFIGVILLTSSCIQISRGDVSLGELAKQHLTKQTDLAMSSLVVISQRIIPQINPCNSVNIYSAGGCGSGFGEEPRYW